MKLDSKIFVAGHRGLVGSAIRSELAREGHYQVILAPHISNAMMPTWEWTLDLRDQRAANDFFASERPEYVFLCAATVGGIMANSTRPADFIYDNLMIQANVLHAARQHGVKKLLLLGSSCIYPRMAEQPIREDALLTGPLEPTNEAYAVAKIAGIKMAQAYRTQYGFNAICAMPTNLYGPGDKSDHVIPDLIDRFIDARRRGLPVVRVWGTGNARREFLHSHDFARAAVMLMQDYDSGEIINVGTGEDMTIRELVGIIARATRYTGDVVFDTTKPEGTPRKLLDVSRITRMGWAPRIPLEHGIQSIVDQKEIVKVDVTEAEL